MWNRIIILDWFSFQFFDIPKNILKGWINILKFNFTYFSLWTLFKTWFSPWRRYEWKRDRGFDVANFFETLFSNLISRIIGFIVRTFLIIIGVFSGFLIFIFGILILVGWFMLPFFLIWGFYHGFRILF